VAPLSTASGPFLQAWEAGALRMSRGEGIWYSRGNIYVVDTSAGTDDEGRRGRGRGAVWELDLTRMRMKCLFAGNDAAVANNPDNITVYPWGPPLLFLCEDGGGAQDRFGFGNRLLGLTEQGAPFIFAKNNVVLEDAQIATANKSVKPGDYRGREFCGACFDPYGRIMFVNIQVPGITFAITGPWPRGWRREYRGTESSFDMKDLAPEPA
jgi:uncharacterized protein